MNLYEHLAAKHFDAIIVTSGDQQLWELAKKMDGVLTGCHLEIDKKAYNSFVKVFNVRSFNKKVQTNDQAYDSEIVVWTKAGKVLGITLYFHKLQLLCFQWLKSFSEDFSSGFFDRPGNYLNATNAYFAMPQLAASAVRKDCATFGYTERLNNFLPRLFVDAINVTDEDTCRKLTPGPEESGEQIVVLSKHVAIASETSTISLSSISEPPICILKGIVRSYVGPNHYLVSKYFKDQLEELVNKKEVEDV